LLRNKDRLTETSRVARVEARFWGWYERNYALNITIAAGLFALQLVHLTWLTGQPLAQMVTGDPLFDVEGPAKWLIVLVDYTEIPALLSVSLIYLNDLRKGFAWKPALYLLFLNSQWLHIFWITDAFVVDTSGGVDTALPMWLAYVAVLIDYLELPVIFDTLRKLAASLRERRLLEYLREDFGG
jgi:hypothetical protein